MNGAFRRRAASQAGGVLPPASPPGSGHRMPRQEICRRRRRQILGQNNLQLDTAQLLPRDPESIRARMESPSSAGEVAAPGARHRRRPWCRSRLRPADRGRAGGAASPAMAWGSALTILTSGARAIAAAQCAGRRRPRSEDYRARRVASCARRCSSLTILGLSSRAGANGQRSTGRPTQRRSVSEGSAVGGKGCVAASAWFRIVMRNCRPAASAVKGNSTPACDAPGSAAVDEAGDSTAATCAEVASLPSAISGEAPAARAILPSSFEVTRASAAAASGAAAMGATDNPVSALASRIAAASARAWSSWFSQTLAATRCAKQGQ